MGIEELRRDLETFTRNRMNTKAPMTEARKERRRKAKALVPVPAKDRAERARAKQLAMVKRDMERAEKRQNFGFNEKKFVNFCIYLRRGMLHGDALQKAQLRWDKARELIDKNPAFERRYAEAIQINTDFLQKKLEDEAYRKALEGAETKTFNARGKLVRKTVSPSDSLHKTLLEANNPAKYGKSSGVTINNVSVDMNNTLQKILEDNARRETLLPPSEVEVGPPERDDDDE